jgi:hypothetical protein
MSKGPTRPAPALGGDRPDPKRPRLWVETFSPQSTRPVELCVLNDWLHGFNVHFIPGGAPSKDRTRPCTQALGECPWCPHIRNVVWKAFLGVHVLTARRPAILEVTLGCWESSEALRHEDGRLRGSTWRFFREKDSNRSRLLAEKRLTILQTPRFGRVDVLSTLARMWNVDFDALARLAETRDGEGGWGHPDCTNHAVELEDGDKTGPFPTARQCDPRGAAEDWRRLRDLEKAKTRKTS